jgi:hypothetical protein
MGDAACRPGAMVRSVVRCGPPGWPAADQRSWTAPKRIAGVYNVGGGPHFGSGLTIDTAAEQYGNKR